MGETEKSRYSAAQNKATQKYIKANYDEIKVRFKKGSKTALQEAASNSGESINAYIKNAIQKRYEADTGGKIDL